MGAVFGNCLSDPRVQVELRDVVTMIREADGTFDAILLDVDNGPDGLTRPGNDALYSEAGLKAACRALRPNGVLAVWSAAAVPPFSQRLSRCGFEVATHTVRASRGKRGNRHTIWIAGGAGTEEGAWRQGKPAAAACPDQPPGPRPVRIATFAGP